MAEAYRFDVSEGPHKRPWTAEYHRKAVRVYAMSLPRPYQINVSDLFGHSADFMAGMTIPGALAEDWQIVTKYLVRACGAIDAWLASAPSQQPASPARGELGESLLGESESLLGEALEIQTATPPAVIRYDLLAALTTLEGALRLERAGLAAQRHIAATSAALLDEEQQRLLKLVASGAQIFVIAKKLGHSKRTVYRELSGLWDALGVPNRAAGLRKAAAEGLIRQ